MSDKMHIWNQVERTDTDYTKRFSRQGGFSGLAIDPMYQIRRATSIFGPMGDRWGLDVIKEQIVDMPEGQKLHYCQIDFWYYNDDDKKCHFQQFGQTMMVQNTKNGPRVIEEAPKMSLTDALTKSLSWLGFSADVWLGSYDGNRNRQHFDNGDHVPDVPRRPRTDAPPRDVQIKKLKKLIMDTKINLDTFLGYYKVDDIDEMKENQLGHAIKTLEARK